MNIEWRCLVPISPIACAKCTPTGQSHAFWILSLVTYYYDEATFTHNRINNTHNSHRWSQVSPHDTVETNFQHRFSINVWCGMIDDMLIGPVILDNHMTGWNYLDFMQNGLSEKLEMFLWLHGILCNFSMMEPLLIIPDLCCSNSMTLSLIGGSVTAVPLTGHQDLQT